MQQDVKIFPAFEDIDSYSIVFDECMASPQNPNVHLEAVEESENESAEPDETWNGTVEKAYRNGNTRIGYWAVAKSGILTHTITDKRLAQAGYFDILQKYESLHI